jgi:hypothetical protein
VSAPFAASTASAGLFPAQASIVDILRRAIKFLNFINLSLII